VPLIVALSFHFLLAWVAALAIGETATAAGDRL